MLQQLDPWVAASAVAILAAVLIWLLQRRAPHAWVLRGNEDDADNQSLSRAALRERVGFLASFVANMRKPEAEMAVFVLCRAPIKE
jgi:hypothetical protein